MSAHDRVEASVKRHSPAAWTLALGGCRAAQARMAAPRPAVGTWPTRVAVLGDALKARLVPQLEASSARTGRHRDVRGVAGSHA
jgi:hypothetical protein